MSQGELESVRMETEDARMVTAGPPPRTSAMKHGHVTMRLFAFRRLPLGRNSQKAEQRFAPGSSGGPGSRCAAGAALGCLQRASAWRQAAQEVRRRVAPRPPGPCSRPSTAHRLNPCTLAPCFGLARREVYFAEHVTPKEKVGGVLLRKS
jgi:hypothetical protein